MAAFEQKPDANGFTGLDTTTSPLLLGNGALSAATNVQIRYSNQIENRAGYAVFCESGARVATATPLTPVALFVDSLENRTAINPVRSVRAFLASTALPRSLFVGRVVMSDNTPAEPSTTSPYVNATAAAAPQHAELVARSKTMTLTALNSDDTGSASVPLNYWGYQQFATTVTDWTASSGLPLATEPRVSEGTYASVGGPARLVNRSDSYNEYSRSQITLGDFETVDNTSTAVTLASTPLGIPQVPYVTATLASAFNKLTDFWVGNASVSTWAYQALIDIDNRQGTPSPPCYVTTPRANTPFGSVVQNASTGSFQFRVAMDNAWLLALNNWVIIDDITVSAVANKTPGAGITQDLYTPISGTPFQVTAFATSGNDALITLTAPSGYPVDPAWSITVNKWRYSVRCDVTLHRPKEQTFDPIYLQQPRTRHRAAFNQGKFVVYRTKVALNTETTDAVDPGADLYEVGRTSAVFQDQVNTNFHVDNSAATVSLNDYTVDTSLGDFLYTSNSQQTALKANDAPPLCSHSAIFNGYTFWGNIETTDDVPLLTLSGFGGDAIYLGVGDINYKLVHTIGTAIAEQYQYSGAYNDETYARAIVGLINSSRNIPVNAQYVSGFQGERGQIALRGLCYRQDAIVITSAALGTTAKVSKDYRQGSFFDLPGTTKQVTWARINLTYRVMYSKFQEPHGCPASNFLDLPRDATILGLHVTSQKLNVVTDRGLWTISGTDETTFSLSQMDASLNAIYPSTMTVLNDTLVVLSNQGVRAYGTGASISRSIDNLVLPLARAVPAGGAWFSSDDASVFNVAVDEANGEYQLLVRDVNSVENRNYMLRFNTFSKAWTITQRDFTCGLWHPDFGQMIYGTRDGTIVMERYSGQPLSHSDESRLVDPAALTASVELSDGSWETSGRLLGAYLYVTDSGYTGNDSKTVEAGDWLLWEQQVAGHYRRGGVIRINRVVPNGHTWLYYTDEAIPTIAAEPVVNGYRVWFVKSVPSTVTLSPFRSDSVGKRKKWTTMQLHFSGNDVENVRVSTSTDEQRGVQTLVLGNPHFTRGFGTYAFGTHPFADPRRNALPTISTLVPRPHNSSKSLEVTIENNAFDQDLRLQGVSVLAEDVSTRVSR